MRSDDPQPELSRRDQAIHHAAELLREGGPSALTSVAVAGRMGITQSAIYRHVTDMTELSALAAELVVSDVLTALDDMVQDPDMDWDHVDSVGQMCRSLVDSVDDNSRAFAVVDQWRFVDGPLGAGIRKLVAEGSDLIGSLLESRWREEFGGEEFGDTVKLSAKGRSTIAVHARAIHEDGQAVTRLVRADDCPFTHEELANILRYRILAGWAAFVIDMNDLFELPFPVIDLAEGMNPSTETDTG
jgi:AcrR family transcriptional regulator